MAPTELITRRTVAALVACLCAACSEPTPDPPSSPAGGGAGAPGSGGEISRYEHFFAFADVAGDSSFLVPWILRATASPAGVDREARGWLERSRDWDAFYSERWTTPATRAPARILPYGNLGFLVQEGDVVDGITFEDGARRLELALGDLRATWGGPRGESVELLDGAAYLSGERFDGVILHMARASAGDASPGGDWALLTSGDSLTLVLSAEAEHGPEVEPAYLGWADLADVERQWPELQVEWTSTQAFPPARRDVPSAWRVVAPDGSLEIELQAVSSEMRAGEGPGPLLPVEALFEVAGQASLDAGDFQVRGLLVHQRR